MTTASGSPKRNPNDRDEAARAKKKLGKLVFGSLIAGGALGLAGMTAQAHGNASSHRTGDLAWNFDDYVVRRELALNPGPRARDLESQLDRLRNLERRTPGGGFAVTGGAGEWRSLAREASPSRRLSLELSLAKSTERLALTPTSRRAMGQVEAGAWTKAIATLETGAPAAVLQNYLTFQTDLYNLGSVDDRSTPAYADETLRVTEAALAYQTRAAPDDLKSRAGLLHNLASAAAPDVGEPSQDVIRAGRQAAEEALQLRRRIGEAGPTGVALYMTGVYKFRDGSFAAAEKDFSESVELLRSSSDRHGLAWSTLYLGLAQNAQGEARGAQNIAEARRMFAEQRNTYALAYLQTEGWRK